MSYFRICRVLVLGCLSFSALSVLAQSADTSGLEVYVHDPSGALVPGAKITVEQTDTHVTRDALADAAGHFRFADLPVGPYKVTIVKPGFESYEQEGIELLAGGVPTLQVRLPIGNSSEKVEVNADTAVIDTDRSTLGQNISQEEIDNLPSDGRSFLDFALTVPGVTSQQSSGQGSGIVFNGQRSRGNNILIDGVENNADLNGTVRQTLSIDAIAQFQVMTGQFQPEYGNSGGGIVNIITKTGTDEFHGDAYYFARRQWMNAYPIILNGAYFNPLYVQNDVGGTLGGPIQKDKTFFFASAEYIGFNTNIPTNVGNTAIVNSILATPLPGTTVKSITSAPVNEATATTNVSVRVDHTFGPRDSLYSRFLYGQYTRANPTLDREDGSSSDVSNYGFDTVKSTGIVAVETHTFSPTIINEARFQYAPQFWTQHPNNFGPTVDVIGAAEFGENESFPALLNESHYEWYDALTLSKRNHLFKFGADFQFIRADTSWPTHMNGYFVFEAVSAPATGTGNCTTAYAFACATTVNNTTTYSIGQPYEFLQVFGKPEIKLPDWQNAGFIQDSWKLLPRLTMDYGIRYDIDLQPQGYNLNPNVLIQQPLPKGMPRDYNNFSPRIGLAYALNKKGSTVIRAGFGFFYDKIVLIIARDQLEPLETYEITSTSGAATSKCLYQNGIFPVRSLYPTDPSYPTNLTCPTAAATVKPSITANPNKFPIPYSQVANLTLDQSFGKDWLLEMTYSHVNGTHELLSTNTNLNAPTIVTPSNAVAITGSTSVPYQTMGRAYYPTTGANPNYRYIEEIVPRGHSRYDGMIIMLTHRATRHLTLRANYTWSKTIDDGSDFTEVADNELLPSAEKSISTEDQRNRFSGSAVYHFPSPSGSEWKKYLLGNWITSSNVVVSSGSPVNASTGYENNNDGYAINRPFWPGLQGQVMRRNNIRGARQQNVSFRLQKEVYLPHRLRLRGSVEAFNLFNHTNYTGIYSTWGDNQAPNVGIFNAFPSHANTEPSCSIIPTPSPCTNNTFAYDAPDAAGATRHLQLGVKLYF